MEAVGKNKSKKFGKIITHNGNAHFDDVFSTSLVIYKCSTNEDLNMISEVHRREPTEEEINDPNIWKLDIGNGHNPNLKLFDHHQRISEIMNECTFSLLLKDWGDWERAINVFEWIQIARIMDSEGPMSVIDKLNISYRVLNSLNSFIERCVLKLFQEKNIIKNTDPLFSLLYLIGKEFFSQIDEYYETLSQVEKNTEYKIIEKVPIIQCLKGVKPTNTLNHILSQKKRAKWGYGGIAIYPNNRPQGSIALKRYDDDERIDFRRIANREKVLFTFPNGFFIVINGKIKKKKLEELIKDAIK